MAQSILNQVSAPGADPFGEKTWNLVITGNNVAGYYVVYPRPYGTLIGTRTKPNAVQRAFVKWLLGWEWIDQEDIHKPA